VICRIGTYWRGARKETEGWIITLDTIDPV
jgi:hypothetical protein